MTQEQVTACDSCRLCLHDVEDNSYSCIISGKPRDLRYDGCTFNPPKYVEITHEGDGFMFLEDGVIQDMKAITRDEKIEMVKRLKEEGKTHREIAKMLGTSISTVSEWLKLAKVGVLRTLDDCPVPKCNGVVNVVDGVQFRCTQGHMGIRNPRTGNVTLPKPPKPSSRLGFSRSSK